MSDTVITKLKSPDESWESIVALYAAVGWTNYTSDLEMLRAAYSNSLLTLAAYDGKRIIGIIRAVGDGTSIVFIQDIIVAPEFQRKGIGTRLMRELVAHFPNVYQMELMTDNTPKTIEFYKSLGFIESSEIGCTAFMRIRQRI